MVGRIVIINDFSVAKGGATALALLAAQQFRSVNIPVTYIAGDNGGNPLFADIGADFIALGGQSINENDRLQGSVRGIYNKAAHDKLASYIAEHDKPDTVYHVHGWAHVLSPLIFSALKPVASRTVIHAHDFFLVCPNGGQYNYREAKPCYLTPLSAACLASNCDKRSYADKLWRSLRQGVLRHLVEFKPGFARILLIHEKMAPYFVRAGIGADRLLAISNPVSAFSPTRVPVENNRHAYFVGRLVTEKGIEQALEAARHVKAPFKVIGDGPLKEELTRRYPEAEFLGWRSPQEIGDLIADARMLVMPTLYPEPFGLVAMEAARSGIPVIVSDTAFLAEDFVNNGIGFACPPEDREKFAAQLRRIADTPADELRAMSERAMDISASISLTPQQWRDALLASYEQALQGARQSAKDIRLFNVKYGSNLGDGLLAECLESGLAEAGAGENSWSIDLSGRMAYANGRSRRVGLLRFLLRFPAEFRRHVTRMPLRFLTRFKWQPHYKISLQGARAVVIGGGNLITDLDLNFPVKLAGALEAAANANLPVVIYGCGVASHWSPMGLSLLRRALQRTRVVKVALRDAASKRNWDAAFGAFCSVASEIVWDPAVLVARYKPSLAKPKPHKTVGLEITSSIALRYHSGLRLADEALSRWYLEVIAAIVAAGYKVKVFTNGSHEDVEFFNLLTPQIPQQNMPSVTTTQPTTPSELASLIASLDGVIAHRMHAIIPAYSYGIPIIALRWDEKLTSFMTLIGMPNRLCDAVTELPASVVVRLFNDADRKSAEDSRTQSAHEALDQVRKLVEQINSIPDDAQFEQSKGGSR